MDLFSYSNEKNKHHREPLASKMRPRNFIYSLGIDFMKNFFSVKEKKFINLRNLFIKKLNKNNSVKDLFFNLADKGLKF